MAKAPSAKKIPLVRDPTPFRKATRKTGLIGIAAYLRSSGKLARSDREFLAAVIERLSRRLESRRTRDRQYEEKRKQDRGGVEKTHRLKWSAAERLNAAVTMIDANKQYGHTAKVAHNRTADWINWLEGETVYKSGESLRQAIKDRKH